MRQRLVFVVLHLVAAFGLWLLHEGGESSATKPTKAKRAKLYVVLIGISRYKQSQDVTPLRYADRDAKRLAKAYQEAGVPQSRLRLLINEKATKAKIKEALRVWLPSHLKRDKQAIGVVFFSGHGDVLGKTSYLLPYDARLKKGKGTLLPSYAIKHNELGRWLAKHPNVVFLLDACHNGYHWSSEGVKVLKKGLKQIVPFKRFGNKQKIKGHLTISSSQQSQYSRESDSLKHGIFTYALLEAFRGQGDLLPKGKGDKVVRFAELWTFLQARVPELSVLYGLGIRQQPERWGVGGGIRPVFYIPYSVLNLRVRPSGADLWIKRPNQEEWQKLVPAKAGTRQSQFQIEGASGRYRFRAQKKGFQARERSISIKPGQSFSVHIQLPKKQLMTSLVRFPPLSSQKAFRPKEVLIRRGAFLMGAPAHEAPTSKIVQYEQSPALLVKISRDIWMFQTEVTQAQYKALMGDNPSHFTHCGENCPVEMVSWHQAAVFANRLSKHAGFDACYRCWNRVRSHKGLKKNIVCVVRSKYRSRGRKQYLTCPGYRLPTEAEWEFAARAGTKGPRYGSIDRIAFYEENSGVTYKGGSKDNAGMGVPLAGPHPVMQKSPNAWGLYDMLGNVWEWTFDVYHEKRYTRPGELDPVAPRAKGPQFDAKHVTRGGSWGSPLRNVRAAARYPLVPYRPACLYTCTKNCYRRSRCRRSRYIRRRRRCWMQCRKRCENNTHLPCGRLPRIGFRLVRTHKLGASARTSR